MDLDQAIKLRRSIRKFKNDTISKEIIESIVDSARLAPSAKNRQPWKFVVVNDKIKNNISEIMLNQLENNNEHYEKNKNSSVKHTAKIMKEAPVLILVLMENNEKVATSNILSVGAAIEHICLKATDLGLGSLWIRDIVYTKDKIAKLICHEEMEVISAISIGYPNEVPKNIPRKTLVEILEWL